MSHLDSPVDSPTLDDKISEVANLIVLPSAVLWWENIKVGGGGVVLSIWGASVDRR